MSCIRKKLAVIGDPVDHSLSPQMHNAALKYLGLELQYSAVRVKNGEIAAFVEEARENYLGFNVTVPHKSCIIPYLDEISIGARLANSVNTVKVSADGKLFGYSTDGYGLERALYLRFGVIPKKEHFLFIGCGGAAQATSAHLLKMGAKSVCFINRNLKKAQAYAVRVNEHFPGRAIKVLSFENENDIEKYIKNNPIVIQSTSVGLKDNDPLILPAKFFKRDLCYFDMIYRDTPFLKCARHYSQKVSNGMLMLLYQGLKSFSIWTEKELPAKIMKDALALAMEDV
jgi:shikimate dehydrogenase